MTADLISRARANGQPAFGAYVRGPDGSSHATGLFVLTLSGDRISAMTRFDTSVLPRFGLPRSLPAGSQPGALVAAGLRAVPAGALASRTSPVTGSDPAQPPRCDTVAVLTAM